MTDAGRLRRGWGLPGERPLGREEAPACLRAAPLLAGTSRQTRGRALLEAERWAGGLAAEREALFPSCQAGKHLCCGQVGGPAERKPHPARSCACGESEQECAKTNV